MLQSEADLGLLQHRSYYLLSTVNYYQRALHPGCCSSSRSASSCDIETESLGKNILTVKKNDMNIDRK